MCVSVFTHEFIYIYGMRDHEGILVMSEIMWVPIPTESMNRYVAIYGVNIT